jgi:dUTPase
MKISDNIVKIFLKHMGKLPVKATEKSACFDVHCNRIKQNFWQTKATVYLGFHLQLPENKKAVFYPRSSITNSNWILQNSVGIGDEDFNGEYQMRFLKVNNNNFFHNLWCKLFGTDFPYKLNERCGQMTVEEVEEFEFKTVETLAEILENKNYTRVGGFGSTGNI